MSKQALFLFAYLTKVMSGSLTYLWPKWDLIEKSTTESSSVVSQSTKLEIPEIKVIFPLHSVCWTKREALHPPGTFKCPHSIPPPSSTSPPSFLLFLSACLVFPPTVLQHDGSIWKCLLKGSGECLQKRAKLLLDSKHWHIYSHADVQMDDSIHRYRRYSYNI